MARLRNIACEMHCIPADIGENARFSHSLKDDIDVLRLCLLQP